MKLQQKKSVYEYFISLEDPRVDRRKRHKLIVHYYYTKLVNFLPKYWV
ncbi:MAG: hypothetical protein SWX82_03350 [Cyanobacteriota bacterium]|nr:hypothetical protein [Cyanobacteriota bacterium]